MGTKKGSIIKVEPIRDRKKIKDMEEYLRYRRERDYVLFVLGINTGLRISDLLKLKAEDVKDGSLLIREKKTGKIKECKLSDKVVKTLNQYIQDEIYSTKPHKRNRKKENVDSITESTYLFPSGKCPSKPVGKIQIWKIIKQAAEACGIDGNIGTHTLRKTFGYWAYKKGIDIYIIMNALNHSNPAVTKRYIGITQDGLNTVCYKRMNL